MGTIQSKRGKKTGKRYENNPRGYTKAGTFTTITHRKTILINQVMLSKIWYLAYKKKPPADIIQNIRKDIHDFLWNNRKVRVNRNTITLPIEMGGLVIMDIETM